MFSAPGVKFYVLINSAGINYFGAVSQRLQFDSAHVKYSV